ncbi:class I SAM-dependent methyltransferase [Lentisalinibacter sediminis]|uniref:class I SAM-dependent methyltransferase n=1 Tax=Lentisalinibacter sediminis TaxID=2992237 RepID=UPI00386D6099
MIFINPQLDATDIVTVYSEGFESKKKAGLLDRSTYAPVLDWMEKYRKINKVLDVGCFNGNFLRMARAEGWNVLGSEISAKAAAETEEECGIAVLVGDLPDLGIERFSCDVVTLFDVIEHVDDPTACLREAHRILRAGGGLYLNTPNIESITSRLLGKEWSAIFPWHQFYFSARTIRQILEQVGFRNIRIYSYGIGPFSRFNAYRALQSEQKIAQRRGRVRQLIGNQRALKKGAHRLLRVLNWPFYLLSAAGGNLGATMVVRAEK